MQELRVTNNKITTIKDLRALPSLRELDVSYNMLSDLNGLQLLPTLEICHAGTSNVPVALVKHNIL